MAERVYPELDEMIAPYRRGANGSGEPGSAAATRFGLLHWPEIGFQPRSGMLVKRLLTEGGSSLVYGDSGSGKTFFVGDGAIRIALGWDWFGLKVMTGGVVYIAAEGGASMRRRIVAFRQHHDIGINEKVPFALIPTPVNLLDGNVDLADLIPEIRRAGEAMGAPLKLIVVDTLSRALAGGNENAPDDMGQFVWNIDRLRAETGAHLLVVHHSGKAASQGARGHSLLRAAVDTEIEVSKSEISGQSMVKVTKQRDGETEAAFAFNLQPVELGIDEDGEAITSCVVVPVEYAAEAKPARVAKRTIPAEYLKALDYLSDDMADHSEPIVASGIPSGVRVVHVDRWREYLKHRGLHDGTENGKKWFQRARNALIAANRIMIDGPYVWIVKQR